MQFLIQLLRLLAFERAFGEILPETGHYGFTASKLAYLNSFPLILYALGVIVASQIGERFGRRSVFIGMNFICIIGAALCYTAKSYGQILAGRMIIMMHVGMEAWLVPMFTAEIVPSAVRGSLVAMYTFNHVFASFISSIVTHETSKIDNNNCWKIPLACIFIFPITVLLTFWLVPESPRWLVRRGKYNEAVKVLFYLNGTTPDYPAEEEATLLLQAVENSVTQGKWGDLFKGTNKVRQLNIHRGSRLLTQHAEKDHPRHHCLGIQPAHWSFIRFSIRCHLHQKHQCHECVHSNHDQASATLHWNIGCYLLRRQNW